MTDIAARLRDGCNVCGAAQEGADEIEKLRLEAGYAKMMYTRLKGELAETIAAFPLGAVKAEQERCAKIADDNNNSGEGGIIAAAIRGTR